MKATRKRTKKFNGKLMKLERKNIDALKNQPKPRVRRNGNNCEPSSSNIKEERKRNNRKQKKNNKNNIKAWKNKSTNRDAAVTAVSQVHLISKKKERKQQEIEKQQ